MNVFSERLRQLRLEKGEQQAEIAKILEVSPQSYSAYENGREPNYDILIKIANHYSASIDYLLGQSSIKNSNLDIRDIAHKTGLSEMAIDYLLDEMDTIRAYSKDPYEKDIAKHHQSYIDFVNTLLEDHSGMYHAARTYEDLLEALNKCDGSTRTISMKDGVLRYMEQMKPENQKYYVLTAREQAEYCVYLLEQMLSGIVKHAVNWDGGRLGK